MSPYRENAKPTHKHRWGYVWGERIADPLFYWGCVECRTHASLVRGLAMDVGWLLGLVDPDNTPSRLPYEDARRWRERDELDKARGS